MADWSQEVFELLFQSTHPARGATRKDEDMTVLEEFQSTHPARGATGGNYRGGRRP